MFETIIRMRLVNPNPVGGCLKEHLEFFKLKVEEMNHIESNYNQKTVSIIEPVEEDVVTLKVVSELELGVPGRAFTGLSRSLLNETSVGYDDFYKNNLFHGRLLAFEKVHGDEAAADKITDTDLILRTVVLANKSKSILTKTERDILTQMKILVANLPNSIEEKEKTDD